MPKRIRKPLYNVYIQMVVRCTRPNHPWYKNYGGRGIDVAERWLGSEGYDNFIKDMGPRPDGLSLDRIDNNLGYSPENCRWASARVQSLNQRTSSKNTSGHPGVTWNKNTNKWFARVWNKQAAISLGSYTELSDAINARKEAEKLYYAPLIEAGK